MVFFSYISLEENQSELCDDCCKRARINHENCLNNLIVLGQKLRCRNGRYKSRALLADVLSAENETMVVDSGKFYQHIFFSSSLPQRTLRAIQAHIDSSSLYSVDLNDIRKIVSVSWHRFFLTLAAMRETYLIFDGCNLSLLGGSDQFSGTVPVKDPVAIIFEEIDKLFHDSEQGLFSICRGEHVTVGGHSVRMCILGTGGNLLPYDGGIFWA